MQRIKYAVIACAGTGSRLGLNVPKCLVEIKGKTIIKQQLELLANVDHIRVVVGFKEEEVIDYVKNIRSDVVFVRNTKFLTTGNSYTFKIGTMNIKEPYIWLDGDVLFNKKSYDKFIKYSINKDNIVLGINKARTSEAVYTILNKKHEVIDFSRTISSNENNFEWSGICYFPKNSNVNNFTPEAYYIYQLLQYKLPVQSCFLEDVYEIDTYEDYLFAKKNLAGSIN